MEFLDTTAEELLRSAVTIPQLGAFTVTDPTALPVRNQAMGCMYEEYDRYMEQGEDKKARKLESAFEKLRENAPSLKRQTPADTTEVVSAGGQLPIPLVQCAAFAGTDPSAKVLRAQAKVIVQKEVDSYLEQGEGEKARELKTGFEELRECAAETEDYQMPTEVMEVDKTAAEELLRGITKGEKLLREATTTPQRAAFTVTAPGAEVLRTLVEMDVQEEADRYLEQGEDEKAGMLKRAFEELRENALEVEDHQMPHLH